MACCKLRWPVNVINRLSTVDYCWDNEYRSASAPSSTRIIAADGHKFSAARRHSHSTSYWRKVANFIYSTGIWCLRWDGPTDMLFYQNPWWCEKLEYPGYNAASIAFFNTKSARGGPTDRQTHRQTYCYVSIALSIAALFRCAIKMQHYTRLKIQYLPALWSCLHNVLLLLSK